MRFSPLAISRTIQVIIVVIIAALAVTPPSGATANAGRGSPLRPLTTATFCPTAVFCYEFVNYNTSDNNYVTGINNHQDIDGAYSSNGSSYGGFAATNSNLPNALSPYPASNFVAESDGALSTYLSGISNGSGGGLSSVFQVGYVAQPVPPETLGAVYLPITTTRTTQTWGLLHDPNQGTGRCAVTELLDIYDSRIGVGFYETNNGTSACTKRAFEVYSNAKFTSPYTYKDLTPTDPSGSTTDVTSSVANGVNILGDVAGTVTWTGANGSQTGGWMYKNLKYITFCFAGAGQPSSCSGSSAAPTFANGINFSDVVVGSYTDQNGQHGFAITDPSQTANKFTTIDIPNMAGTVVWSINEGTGTKSEFFTGWTTPTGSNAKALGIVGICEKSHCSQSGGAYRRSHNHLKVERP